MDLLVGSLEADEPTGPAGSAEVSGEPDPSDLDGAEGRPTSGGDA